jgi:hypothetical protein
MAKTLAFDHRQIEEELIRIQQQSAPTEARATILNLLVFADMNDREEAERALGYVLGKRAARIVLVVNSTTPESNIAVSARCYLDPERRSVCLQEVIVENGRDQLGTAVNTWSPLLIRDIPVYAWWRLDIDPDNELLRSIQELSDKVIVDTEIAFEGDETLAKVLSLHDRLAMAISDFAWLRIQDLRLLVARAFDSEELLNRLSELQAVSISGAPPAYSRLFVGWLASRLGWRRIAGNEFKGPGGEVAVSFGPGGSEESLELAFRFREGAPVTIRTREGTAVVEGVTPAPYECVFEVPTTGQLLLQNIDSAYSEFLYLDALRGWLGQAGLR